MTAGWAFLLGVVAVIQVLAISAGVWAWRQAAAELKASRQAAENAHAIANEAKERVTAMQAKLTKTNLKLGFHDLER